MTKLIFFILSFLPIVTFGQSKNEQKLLFNKAKYFDRQENIDSVLYYIRKINKIDKKKLSKSELATLNLLSLHAYYYKSEFDKAIDNGQEALSYYKSVDSVEQTGEIYFRLGACYRNQFKSKEAITYFKLAEKKLKNSNLTQVYLGLGNTYYQLNDIEESITYLLKAQSLAEQFDLENKMSTIYNSLAAAYNKNDDSDNALNYLEKSLFLANKTNSNTSRLLAYFNLGSYYLDKDDLDNATKNFKESYNLINKTNYNHLKARATLGYADVLILNKKLEEAEVLIDKAQNLYNTIGNKNRMPYVYNLKAEIENKKGNIDNAINLLKQGLEISKDYEITDIIIENYLDLAELEEKNLNYKKALLAYKNYSRLNDSLNKKQKTKEIETLKIKYEVSEMETNLKLKDQKLTNLEIEKKASNYRNVLLSIVGIGLVFFIFRQYKINKITKKVLESENEIISLKKQQLENEVSFKKNKITEYAIHINDRNKFLEVCKKQLKDIQKLAENRMTSDKAKELHFFIKNHIETQKEDIVFNTETQSTGADFNYKLQENFPNLTDKEILVCNYLILNLSSKKIADKMNISFLSVNNYRTSIRKKINLPKGGNLKRALQQLS